MAAEDDDDEEDAVDDIIAICGMVYYRLSESRRVDVLLLFLFLVLSLFEGLLVDGVEFHLVSKKRRTTNQLVRCSPMKLQNSGEINNDVSS